MTDLIVSADPKPYYPISHTNNRTWDDVGDIVDWHNCKYIRLINEPERVLGLDLSGIRIIVFTIPSGSHVGQHSELEEYIKMKYPHIKIERTIR